MGSGVYQKSALLTLPLHAQKPRATSQTPNLPTWRPTIKISQTLKPLISISTVFLHLFVFLGGFGYLDQPRHDGGIELSERLKPVSNPKLNHALGPFRG